MNEAEVLGRETRQQVRPLSIADVQAALKQAQETAQSVIPWGGGTGQDYGAMPRKADILLDMGGLNGLVAHEYADMTVTAQAGMTLAALQEQLALHGQFLPLDPPQPERATLGGILATNASGPLRLGYGTVRDWLIGITVVDAQGRCIHGGGKVVKNVTGYDLPKLHIGALGTLGVVVELTFKVAPKPETARTLVAQAGPASDLTALAARLWQETLPVSLLLHEDTQGCYLVALYHGSDAITESATARGRELAQECSLAAHQVYPGELLPQAGRTPLQMQLTTAPDTTVALHNAAWDTLAETGVCLESALGVGTVTLTWDTVPEDALKVVERVLLLARVRGVRFALLHGPLSLRTGAVETLWFPVPPSRVFQERVKEALDPSNILNPGRFLCGI